MHAHAPPTRISTGVSQQQTAICSWRANHCIGNHPQQSYTVSEPSVLMQSLIPLIQHQHLVGQAQAPNMHTSFAIVDHQHTTTAIHVTAFTYLQPLQQVRCSALTGNAMCCAALRRASICARSGLVLQPSCSRMAALTQQM